MSIRLIVAKMPFILSVNYADCHEYGLCRGSFVLITLDIVLLSIAAPIRRLTDAIIVDFRARSAGASFSHLPEVVLHVSGQNSGLGKAQLQPDVLAVLK